MKETAVFHYTEWKNRKRKREGGHGEDGRGREKLGKHTDRPRTGFSKQRERFLEPVCLISGCKSVVCLCVYMRRDSLTHRAEGAHAVAALLPRQVLLVAYGAHAIGSRVAIETTACGTKHGHRALVRLLGHCYNEREREMFNRLTETSVCAGETGWADNRSDIMKIREQHAFVSPQEVQGTNNARCVLFSTLAETGPLFCPTAFLVQTLIFTSLRCFKAATSPCVTPRHHFLRVDKKVLTKF